LLAQGVAQPGVQLVEQRVAPQDEVGAVRLAFDGDDAGAQQQVDVVRDGGGRDTQRGGEFLAIVWALRKEVDDA
jgi:hypothetical protein